MIRISTKGRYGTRLMLELAMNYEKGPMLLKEIAKKQEISEGYLQHIVDTLKGSGLIFSNRIGHGGYTLAKPPEKISLRDILSSLEGSINLSECVNNPDICTRSPKCTTRDAWSEVNRKLSQSLSEITLRDMVEKNRNREPNTMTYKI
jgi:Rrf2 family protein